MRFPPMGDKGTKNGLNLCFSISLCNFQLFSIFQILSYIQKISTMKAVKSSTKKPETLDNSRPTYLQTIQQNYIYPT